MIPLILASSLFLSCNRTKERSIQPAKDYALLHQNLSEIIPIVIHTGQSHSYLVDRLRSGTDTLNSCATYHYLQGDTVDISQSPVQFEITFSQCYDFDNELKNGTLKCIQYEYFNVDSSNCFVTFDAFSLNGNLISGSFNLRKQDGNNYKISTSNLEIIVGTRAIRYQGAMTYQMSTGAYVDLLYDNSLVVIDNSVLTDRYGTEVEIRNEGIGKSLACKWFSSGFVELEDNEAESIVLDFGTGSCDNDATVTNTNEDIIIEL